MATPSSHHRRKGKASAVYAQGTVLPGSGGAGRGQSVHDVTLPSNRETVVDPYDARTAAKVASLQAQRQRHQNRVLRACDSSVSAARQRAQSKAAAFAVAAQHQVALADASAARKAAERAAMDEQVAAFQASAAAAAVAKREKARSVGEQNLQLAAQQARRKAAQKVHESSVEHNLVASAAFHRRFESSLV